MATGKMVIAAGTGFLGSELAKYFSSRYNEIVILTRKPRLTHHNIRYVLWDAQTTGPWIYELDGADVLINLTGKNVNCRYHQKNKDEILNSRLRSTSALCQAMRLCKKPPRIWLNAASATIYRHSEDKPMDERTGEIGTGFSVNVCTAWEKRFDEELPENVRGIVLRIAIVFGKGDGVYPRLIRLAKFGLGGQMGNGRQMFSWVHVLDVCRSIEFLISREDLSGIFNISAPNPVANREVMQLVRQNVGNPVGLPSPEWLLSIGAVLIGTETELILKSRYVVPSRLLEAGFTFAYPTLQDTLADLKLSA